ncbi:MAG: class I SAM-dependent methyltransferase [Candidatus Latescibacterota bacterium]|nr:MAG: class I SAM-dependent methyltransferase [Candidatus Latescibacterota bacterium]
MRTPKKKTKRGSKKPNRHDLYQIAVQSPDYDVPFFDRVYKKKNGKLPRVLREDFCGTAFLSAEWVRTRPGNRAIGVDLDRSVLDWGRANNIVPLGDDAKRVTLVHKDVRTVNKPRADVIAALNFSYFVFKDRSTLLGYFRNTRRSLARGGIFVMDIFGGWESQMEITDTTRHPGFTYVWEQKGVDPISNIGCFHIHFRLNKGQVVRKAFTYDWRVWSIPEVRDLLLEAGFDEIDVYWEGIDDETSEGDGVYRRAKKTENSPGWNALIVAS